MFRMWDHAEVNSKRKEALRIGGPRWGVNDISGTEEARLCRKIAPVSDPRKRK